MIANEGTQRSRPGCAWSSSADRSDTRERRERATGKYDIDPGSHAAVGLPHGVAKTKHGKCREVRSLSMPIRKPVRTGCRSMRSRLSPRVPVLCACRAEEAVRLAQVDEPAAENPLPTSPLTKSQSTRARAGRRRRRGDHRARRRVRSVAGLQGRRLGHRVLGRRPRGARRGEHRRPRRVHAEPRDRDARARPRPPSSSAASA